MGDERGLPTDHLRSSNWCEQQWPRPEVVQRHPGPPSGGRGGLPAQREPGRPFRAPGDDAPTRTGSAERAGSAMTRRIMRGTVGVVGGGIMGAGIAEVCARSGYDVVVREVDDAA